MRGATSAIKDVLKAVVTNISGEKGRKVDLVKEAWGQVVDRKAHIHATPASFKAKKLVVNVDSSAWMYELNLRKAQIKAGLNEKLKKDDIEVTDIILRI